MTQKERSWEKRLAGEPNQVMMRFVESLSFDQRLYKYDIMGSIAHATMLCEQDLITSQELDAIKTGLAEIQHDIEAGTFVFDFKDEDIHMAIESALIEKIGAPGEKLHTGRSRNDQVATDIRLWMREQITVVQDKIRLLQQALVNQAEKYTTTLLPSYTHFQRAQPVVVAAYLMSFVEQIERDFLRLGNCGDLLNWSPLGSGAIAGSTLPIDREATAKSLGFNGPTANSIDSVSDRDFCAEFTFDCALLSAHLSRIAEDWIIYSTSEFGFIRIDDTLCTCSSMMPQKKNPDALELVRGKTGTMYGALMAMMTILKAQPSGYNRDLQDDKMHVFKASDTIEACLDVMHAVVTNTTFNAEHIKSGLDAGFLDATALAEYLVIKGVAFRKAHGIVGTLVSQCETAKCKLSDLTLDQFKELSGAIEDDVYSYLGPAGVAQRYASSGAGGPKQAQAQINAWKERLAQ
jgi:argininosuccinate lyase